MIFQEPMTALDPVYTIGAQIAETVRRHKGGSRAEARARALELLEVVKIPEAERRLDNYPHELSGGLRQRAMIAMALSCGPRLLLADEPTTALDATVQIQVLILLRKLQRELGMGTIFVTHDLGVASEIADRIAVMYAGRIVEEGAVGDVLRSPMHPYTQGLLTSTMHGQHRDRDIEAIPGSPPDVRRLPSGCAFAPRCAKAEPECRTAVPEPRYPSPHRMVRCIRIGDTALVAAECWRSLAAARGGTCAAPSPPPARGGGEGFWGCLASGVLFAFCCIPSTRKNPPTPCASSGVTHCPMSIPISTARAPA